MDGAPDIAAGQERDGVACIYGERCVLRLHPLPLIVDRVTNLECRNGLAEE